MKATEGLTLKVTKEQKNKIKEEAGKKNLSIANYLRYKLFGLIPTYRWEFREIRDVYLCKSGEERIRFYPKGLVKIKCYEQIGESEKN